MRSNHSNSNLFTKTASFVLAVLFLMSAILVNKAAASTLESSPWIYDTARVGSQSSVGGQYGDYKELYDMPLPQGVNGLTPSLQLNYSSQNDNYDSYLGYGWSLSIPSIERINKNGVNNLYIREDYASSLDGELTKVSTGIYKSQIEIDSFKSYEKTNDVWTTFESNGLKYTFGTTSTERQNNSASTTQIYAWLLSTIEDTNGNKITYQYIKDDNRLYPAKIFYGYINQANPSYEVRFIYSSTTPYTTFSTGFSVINKNILESIEIYFNGTISTKYDLNYSNAGSNNTKLLIDVTKTGYSDNGAAATASPKYFAYKLSTTTAWETDSNIAATLPSKLLTAVSDTGQNYTQYSRDILIDINGDSLADWVEGSTVYLNTGNGWQATSTWPALPVSNFYVENRLADVNGDLLPDIITSKKESYDYRISNDIIYTKSVKINQGDGTWVENTNWANTIPNEFYWQFWNYPGGITYVKQNVYLADINGDGLSDWLREGSIYLNTGSGWASTSSWTQLPSGASSFDDKWRLADVNGDSLPDLIMSEWHTFDYQWNQPSYGAWVVKLNRGDGTWQDSATWSDTIPRGAESFWDHQGYPAGKQTFYRKVYLADVNGDNLNDWLYGNTAYLNTGSGWSTTSIITLPVNTEELVQSYRLADIDGDNQLDFVRYFYRWFFGTQTHTKEALINKAQKLWSLSTTTSEYGGITSITYDVTTTKENNLLLNPVSPVVKEVVKKIVKNPINNGSVTTEFTYKGGDLYFDSTNIFNRKFAGFNQVTQTNALSKVNTFFHQGNNNSTSSWETNDTYAKIAFPYRFEVTDLSNDLYNLSVINYDTYNLATSSNFVKKARVTILNYDGDSDHRDSSTEYTYSNNTGLTTSNINFGRVTANTDGTYTDVTGDKVTTEYEYASSTGNHILGLISKQTQKDETNNKIQESRHYYDSQSLGTVTKGNQTKEERLISGSSYASTTRTYNSYGLVTSETDPRGKTTTYTYDSYNLYPATSTNPLSQSTKFEYDYSSGKVATTTDSNGEKFVTLYDGLDRPISEKVPDASTGTLVTKNQYVYANTIGAVNIKQTTYLNSATSSTAYTYLDGFGRKIQERSEMEDTNIFSVRDYHYGANGLLLKESLPYSSTGASSTASTSNQNLYTNYSYDPLDRIVSANNSVGSTATDRDQWTETVTDALGNEKDYVYDAYGRLVQVKENNGAQTYTTTYTWNHLSNLTKIADTLGNVRNLTYDNLGRRLTLEDLHGATDTTFGSWAYNYDLAGNLATTTNPKGQVTGYTYDSLNRPLTENFTGQAGTEVTYTYDSCTKGIGRLCTAVSSGATTTLAYDRLGQTATETRAIGGTAYTTKYEHDRLGNKTRIIYPDNSEVTYTHNKANKIENVRQKESGGTFKTIISDIDYGPHGLVTYQLHGNGASTTKTYNQNALYRLLSILTTATSTYGTGGAGEELMQLEESLFAPTEEILTTALTNEEVPIIEETIYVANEAVIETPQTIEILSTTTDMLEEIVIPEVLVATTTPSTTDTTISIEIIATTTEVTNEEIVIEEIVLATTTELTLPLVEELKPTKRQTEKLITNSYEARVWKKFHEERVAGIREAEDAPKEALEAALYAQDQFESFLFEKGYTDAKGEKVKTKASDFVKKLLDKIKEEIVAFILPDFAYAYLFGNEDFENCSTLPCSFNNVSTWGGVTQSLDSTSKVSGVDSLKEVVTGEGSAALESINYNEDEVWVQFKVFIPSAMTWGASGYFTMLRFEDSSNGSVFRLTLENWGTVRLTMAGDTLPWTDTGLNLTTGAVNTIEVRFKKGTTNGDVDIWLNNSTQGSPSYNGSGALNTGTDNVDDVLVGVTYAPESGIATTYFDDIVIDTAFIGNASGGGTPNTPFTSNVQNLSYTYDAVGNITQIIDKSGTLSAATTSYQYDALYRLTNASTTQASTTPYVRTYTYDALGNILTASDLGTYSYSATSGETTYAIYSDSVASGWVDWSWSTTMNPSNTSPVHSGTYSLRAVYGGAWTGMSYHTSSFNSTPYNSLRLKVNVGTSTAVNLYAYFTNQSGTALTIINLEDYISGDFVANTWHTIDIPLSSLGFANYNNAASFNIEASQAGTVYYDQIEFIGTAGGSPSYANPHAVTAIGSTAYNYDLNGNLASTSVGLSNTWSYHNYLLSSLGGGTASTSYSYDQTGQRTMKVSGGVTTRYPNALYEVKGATTTKQVYVGDELVASIESDTPAPSVYYNHLDHLGSTQVVTGEDGYLTQVLGYYPFGDARIEQTYGNTSQDIQFTGHTYDEETELLYMGARYYPGDKGRFLSQDPANLDLGSRSWEQTYGRPLEIFLRDPQQLNTYSYARNNPITVYDPGGDIIPLALAVVFAGIASFATDVNYAYAPDTSTDLTSAPAGTNPLVPGYDNMSPSQKLSLQLAFMAFGSKANVGSLVKQGDNLVPVFRGGSGDNLFSIKPNEIKVNADGFVVNTRGVSVNTDASSLNRFGGANQIEYLPDTLKINQIGNANHYEIVPNSNLTPKQFQSELNKIKTRRVEE
jgi:RHS repeat-associated protein